jgi:hypothetical protein
MILRSDLAHVAEYASRATQMRGKTAAVREDFGLAKISTTATFFPTCRG